MPFSKSNGIVNKLTCNLFLMPKSYGLETFPFCHSSANNPSNISFKHAWEKFIFLDSTVYGGTKTELDDLIMGQMILVNDTVELIFGVL